MQQQYYMNPGLIQRPYYYAPETGTSVFYSMAAVVYILYLTLLSVLFITVGGGIMVLIVGISFAKGFIVYKMMKTEGRVTGCLAIYACLMMVIALLMAVLMILLAIEYRGTITLIESCVLGFDALLLSYLVIAGANPCSWSAQQYVLLASQHFNSFNSQP